MPGRGCLGRDAAELRLPAAKSELVSMQRLELALNLVRLALDSQVNGQLVHRTLQILNLDHKETARTV